MGYRATILCVDDDPAVLRTTALILEHAGYVVATAENVEDALKADSAVGFDLLLLDNIPEMRSAIQQARRANPKVRIALFAGVAQQDPLPVDIDIVFPKPTPPYVLLTKIAELIGTASGARSA